MDKRLNGKNQIPDDEKRKQALIILKNWLQNLNIENKNTKEM
ncbi:hypothetical protein RCG17_22815 [Neobacillus sp. PS3-12]|nr:hypothetical protein [Neobacillus sp. PS3-12]WML52192.1 hypothetical protein RCG17_22815 [Neobacillus sp. PS3-12]